MSTSRSPQRLPHFLRVVRALARVPGVAAPVAAVVTSVAAGCGNGAIHGVAVMGTGGATATGTGGSGGGSSSASSGGIFVMDAGYDGTAVGDMAMPDAGYDGHAVGIGPPPEDGGSDGGDGG